MKREPKNKKITNNQGFTLVEILMTVMILAIGIVGSMLYFTSASASTSYARDLTMATSHGEYILEEMRSRSNLSDITGQVNWTTWADTAGLNGLDNESITVSITDSASNPLDSTSNPQPSNSDIITIVVTVNWQSSGQPHSTSFTTEMTK